MSVVVFKHYFTGTCSLGMDNFKMVSDCVVPSLLLSGSVKSSSVVLVLVLNPVLNLNPSVVFSCRYCCNSLN